MTSQSRSSTHCMSSCRQREPNGCLIELCGDDSDEKKKKVIYVRYWWWPQNEDHREIEFGVYHTRKRKALRSKLYSNRRAWTKRTRSAKPRISSETWSVSYLHVDVSKTDLDKVPYELSEIPTTSKTKQKFSRPCAANLTELWTTLQRPSRRSDLEQESAVQLDVRCNVQQMSLPLDAGVRVRSTLSARSAHDRNALWRLCVSAVTCLWISVCHLTFASVFDVLVSVSALSMNFASSLLLWLDCFELLHTLRQSSLLWPRRRAQARGIPVDTADEHMRMKLVLRHFVILDKDGSLMKTCVLIVDLFARQLSEMELELTSLPSSSVTHSRTTLLPSTWHLTLYLMWDCWQTS